jgi:hypothetical protein
MFIFDWETLPEFISCHLFPANLDSMLVVLPQEGGYWVGTREKGRLPQCHNLLGYYTPL